MRLIKVATRASRLALIQTKYVCELLRKLKLDVKFEIIEVSTKGDRDKSSFLCENETVGFFTIEVEKVLLGGRADLAVHSFKDLPTAETKGLLIAAVPKRESAADALVSFRNHKSIKTLPAGATVGTSSLRRIAQAKHIRNDLKCVPLRGNVETRVRKVMAGKIDAAILACAGLNRLGLSGKISASLPPDKFIPAPAQGALAVQVRSDNSELIKFVSQIDNRNSRMTSEAERYVLAAMRGGCSVPVGVYSYISENDITINAVVCSLDGSKHIALSKVSSIRDYKGCAENLAQKLLDSGGDEILKQIRSGK